MDEREPTGVLALAPRRPTNSGQAWDGTHDLVAGQIRSAERSGEVPASLDPDRERVVLASLLDGLVSHVMVGHYSGEVALAAVDAHFDRQFG
jgi:TetR/AcrR family transcriptional repressor of bet genes